MDTLLSRQETILSEGPYKGLRPYEEQDQYYFFGRDADCGILIDKVLANRLTLLFAATGVGKSSLLQAAILPRLKDPNQEHLDVVYYRDWVERPLIELKRTVLHILQESGKLDAALELEDIESSTLKEFMQFCTLFTRPPLVVILDQFEEFFQYQRMRDTFQPFLQQLADVVTDRVTPVTIVIAMREDFALELNALKPYLPTLLFENFYRLERLNRKNAKDAIILPVARVGFQYEEVLVDAILTDLVTREQASPLTTPVTDLIETVEPPYLQITCSELWKIEEHNPEKTLRFETYKNKGRAQGLLKTYVENVLNGFSAAEQRLASLAFNHLITRRGTKMAFTVPDLASLLDEDPQALGKVLNRLSTARILRSQSRGQVLWYELYHDLFSPIIETWNDAYKNKQRNKRALFGAGLILLVVAAIYTIYDVAVNATNYHLRLSVREASDTLDLYRGKAGSRDLFGLQQYQGETGYRRAQMEPDKLFVQKPVNEIERLNIELIGLLPLEERIVAYWKSGHVSEAKTLAESSISDDNVERSQAIISRVARFDSLKALEILEDRFKQLQTTHLKGKIATAVGSMRVPKGAIVLTAALNGSDPEVRRSAVRALGQLGSPQAVPALLERLSDQSREVRESAADALGQLGSPQAVPALLERLKDRHNAVRYAILFALGKIDLDHARDAATAVLADPAEERWVKAMAAAILLNFNHQESLSYLSDLARSESAVDRMDCAVVLGSFSTAPALALLTQLLEDENLQVKTEAVTSLGEIKSTTTISTLARLVTDDAAATHVNLQRAAVTALGRMATEDSLRILRLALANSDLSIPARLAALAALGTSKAETAVESLLETAEQEEIFLRSLAYKLLGERQLHRALRSLHQHLTQLREQYNRWRGIRDTAREDFTNEETEEWKKQLNTTRPPSYWSFEVAYTMARIDPERVGVEMLSHDLGDVRHGAWMGLGEVGTVSLVQRLHNMRMQSNVPLLRHALYRAIDHILVRIEATGIKEDLAALQSLLPGVRETEEVSTRVEWTILQLERHYHDASASHVNHPN